MPDVFQVSAVIAAVPSAPRAHRPLGGDDREADLADRGDDGALSRPAWDLLTTIPGTGLLAAAAVISGTAADIRDFFPQRGAPGVVSRDVSLYPRIHCQALLKETPQGNWHLQPGLVQCAWAVVRHTEVFSATFT